ncbi:Npun_F0296 family exosortase-dependent surface protein [Paraglaciecola hydrolytica]|uniref:PEP-CTERM protein-sorting domain-containing protein n=1 Tax=Paraglaciecola hydrolytica TaxID=1799789 RepID=A0A136A041_9ALTE|nr:PEP-CTERM sorting domain-containing protein [Paraglaciecola hydrolytica]KXI28520.1 hypothetical protein AX660_15635 [Paraglaciecola hydrolytica]
MKNLFNKSKVFSASLVLAMAMAGSASAATISFGGQAATDGSNKTSSFVPADNMINDPSLGYFIETFDVATAVQPFGSDNNTDYNIAGASTGCAINSPLGIVAAPAGSLGVRTGSVASVAAAPAGDTTCYGYTTNNGSGTSSVSIDYTGFLAGIGGLVPSLAGSFINYLGFYWGSVDTYNTFEFYSDNVLVKSITGQELLTANSGTSGDQTGDGSNVYVNIDFSPAESFNKFVVKTSGVAGEFDNIVVGLDKRPPPPVPAPAGLALLGLGLVGIGFSRRFKK